MFTFTNPDHSGFSFDIGALASLLAVLFGALGAGSSAGSGTTGNLGS